MYLPNALYLVKVHIFYPTFISFIEGSMKIGGDFSMFGALRTEVTTYFHTFNSFQVQLGQNASPTIRPVQQTSFL
jgi:hypothetical protein